MPSWSEFGLIRSVPVESSARCTPLRLLHRRSARPSELKLPHDTCDASPAHHPVRMSPSALELGLWTATPSETSTRCEPSLPSQARSPLPSPLKSIQVVVKPAPAHQLLRI